MEFLFHIYKTFADFFSNAHLLIIVSFFLISILIGFIVSRKEDDDGFLIANRKLETFQSIMTLSGSFVGAMTLLVYTAFVFTYGISALWIFVGYFLGFIVFSYFAIYLKKYSKGKNFYTIADFFEHKFNRKTALLIISILFVWYFGTLSAQFIGGGKVLTQISGWSFEFSAITMFLVIVTYLILGGFKSVVKTDIFQFSILGIILIMILFTIKNGIIVPVEYFNPFNAGIVNIIAFLLLGFLTPFATQDYWQRVFAMKDVKVVKKSFVISGVLVFIVSVFLTYIGLIAKTNFANIDADVAVLQSFTQLVPSYLIPFVAVAFFAAILSSADTFLFLLGINTVNDFLGNKIKSKKLKVRYTRVAILIIGFLSLLLALIYPNIVNITIIFKAIGLIVAPIVLICWLSGGNSKTINYTLVSLGIIIIGLALIGYIKPELAIIGCVGGLVLYGIYSLLFKIKKKFLFP